VRSIADVRFGRAFVAPSGQLSVVTVLDCKGHVLPRSEARVDDALDVVALDALLACDDTPTVEIARDIRAMNRPEREEATSVEVAIPVIPTISGGRCET
jgi:hypothetical protein